MERAAMAGEGERRGDPFSGRSLILSLNEVRTDKFEERLPSESKPGVCGGGRHEGDHAFKPSTSSLNPDDVSFHGAAHVAHGNPHITFPSSI